MPIDTGSMMLRLNPMSPIDLGGGGRISMERERLRLAREQFAEERRQHEARLAQQREAERGEMARAKLLGEREAAKAAAEVAAQRQKDQLAALNEFSKLAGQGDIEGAHALIPVLDSLGKEVTLEGEEAGLPRYRIEDRAEMAKRAEQEFLQKPRALDSLEGEESATQSLSRMGGLGYPTDELGAMNEPPGIGSTSEAFTRATGAMAESEVAPRRDDGSLAPTRAPDTEDLTGAVPRNVIDLGAIQAQTLARLNPALSGLVSAYPEPYRDSARQTADAVAGLGLPAGKAVEKFDQLRGGGPDMLIAKGIEADAQKDKREGPSFMEQQTLYDRGFKYAEKAAGSFEMKNIIGNRDQYKIGLERLTNKDDTDDYLVGALISRRMGERGATTEPDVERVLGTASMSFFDRILSRAYKEAIGGLSLKQRNSLITILKEWQAADVKKAQDYIQQIEDEASAPGTTPDVARGMRAYVRAVVPKSFREGLVKKTSDDAGGGKRAAQNGATDPSFNDPEALAGAGDEDFDELLRGAALENGLDPEKLGRVMSAESGGNPAAVNSKSGATGLIQMMPSVAKALGTSTEELAKMSKSEQLPYVMKYFADKGLTEEDDLGEYYMAVAAPAFVHKPDATVVYPKGSKAWEQNPAWRPADGGDITVADIKRFGAGGNGGAAKAKTAEEQRVLDLLGVK